MMKTHRIEISTKTIVFTIGFLLFLWFLFQIRTILLLVFIGFILMTAVQPLVNLAKKFHIPVLPIMLLLYIVVIFIISMVVASLVPAFLEQSKSLISHYPSYISSLESSLNISLDPGIGSSYISSVPSNILKVAAGAFSNVLNILAVFFIAYYLVLERPNLNKSLARFFPDGEAEKKAENLIKDIEKAVGGWVRGELILMLIIGLMTYGGLILLGIPYALPLAVLAGMLELVPNIGPTIAAVPAILMGFTVSPFAGFGALVLSILVQQLENNLIVPRVMFASTGTKPLVTILTLLIGYTLAGVGGAVLAMPLYLTGTKVYKHITK